MISLINVINNLDINGKPVGHGLKCLQDMVSLLQQPVEILAGKEYIQAMRMQGGVLPCSIYTGVAENKSLKTLRNYFISLFKAKGNVLIYTIVTEAVLWGIALYCGKRKIVLVTYDDWNVYQNHISKHKKIRRWLIRKALSKVSGCIVTNNFYIPPTSYIRIPDYYVSKEMLQYRRKEKVTGCICLGEIRYGKDTVGLVKCLSGTGIPLKIAGSFSNKEQYRKTKIYSKENVQVFDKILPYDEYLEELSSYKYLVLPYDAEYYDGRTSGVLLEGVFVGAIPIAPCSLLEQNGIQGLGYRRMTEIPDLIKKYEQGAIRLENSLKKYQFHSICRKVGYFLDRIEEG